MPCRKDFYLCIVELCRKVHLNSVEGIAGLIESAPSIEGLSAQELDSVLKLLDKER